MTTTSDLIQAIKQSPTFKDSDAFSKFYFKSNATGEEILLNLKKFQSPSIVLSCSNKSSIDITTAHSLVQNKIRDYSIVSTTPANAMSAYNCFLVPGSSSNLEGLEFDINELFNFCSRNLITALTTSSILQISSMDEIQDLFKTTLDRLQN